MPGVYHWLMSLRDWHSGWEIKKVGLIQFFHPQTHNTRRHMDMTYAKFICDDWPQKAEKIATI